MIIDFHTHVYPEKIAHKLMKELADTHYWGHYTEGTIDSLLSSMKEAGIDLSLTMPVVTRPSQYASINAFALSQMEIPGLLPFGGIHPDCEDIKGKLKDLKSMGFPGIKLHHDWIDTFVDDEKSIYLIRQALEEDLIVLLHAGYDGAFPDVIHCVPERTLRLLESLEDPGHDIHRLVIAHSGGHLEHADVKKYLLGAPCYFDISLSQMYLPARSLRELIAGHGIDRLLFGSDSPYGGQKSSVEGLKARPITQNEYNKITEKNAKKLLRL